MIVMGVDPGLSSTGYGVLEACESRLKALGFGQINTPPGKPMSERLAIIYGGIKELILSYRPELVVVEEIFWGSNAKSAMAVGHSRGAVLLAAAHCGVGVEEYTPLQVKYALVGNGRAEKRQVLYMVKALLGLEEEIGSSHAGDALALAICHVHHSGPGAGRMARAGRA
ncbi:MAG: crossover junction endodeoxyribonuclease RuvC [Candidatus Geothermincolales bacterium]